MLRKLEEIRNSDKATKYRWLIILSGISFAFVLAVWVIALRVIVTDIENKEVATAEVESGPGFLASVKNMFSELGTRTGTAVTTLKNAVGKKEIQLTQASSTK